MSSAVHITGGTIVTMNAQRSILEGDLLLDGGRIVAIGKVAAPAGAKSVDASGCIILPGLIQAHTHLCQTLLRGGADDLPLLAWLKKRVWPYEAALDEAAMRASVRLAVTELLLGGTTAILDMATVNETDALFDEVAHSGLRAVIGKAMMDLGADVPDRLRESTRAAIDSSDQLAKRWTGAADGRIGYAYAPRFVPSCSQELLEAVGARLKNGARVHTHASEQVEEVELVRKERGDDNILYLAKVGITGPRATLAHCVHATAGEHQQLASSGTNVTHCPSSNLKLGSGVAPIPEMLALGIHVAIGADGAPCNNNLDVFVEMRLAALLPKPRLGADAMPATKVLELATLGGARALGLEQEIGSLEIGKRADVLVVDPRAPHVTPSIDPVSTLVYAVQSRDVRHLFVDGRQLVENGALTSISGLHVPDVLARARTEASRVVARTS